MKPAFIFDETLTRSAHEIMPYAAAIGLRAGHCGKELMFLLPFREDLIGNTYLPALHGGLIGGFMESAAALHLKHSADLAALPKPVDFSLDYLRPGKTADTYAQCSLTRQGSRVAHLTIHAWQDDDAAAIAVGRIHFLMPETHRIA